MLKERSAKLLNEAKTMQEAISRFLETYELKVAKELRMSLVKDIDGIVTDIMRQVREKQSELNTHKGREVWTYAYSSQTEDGHIIFGATDMNRASSWYIAEAMEKKHQAYLPVDLFTENLDRLRSSILSGELDTWLKRRPNRLLYETMKATLKESKQ